MQLSLPVLVRTDPARFGKWLSQAIDVNAARGQRRMIDVLVSRNRMMRDRNGWQRATTSSLLLAVVLATVGAPAIAQDSYPNRPVKIIAPQAPGGGVDLVARIIAERLRVAMGQPFLVDN